MKIEKIFLKDWQHFNILEFYMGNYKHCFNSLAKDFSKNLNVNGPQWLTHAAVHCTLQCNVHCILRQMAWLSKYLNLIDMKRLEFCCLINQCQLNVSWMLQNLSLNKAEHDFIFWNSDWSIGSFQEFNNRLDLTSFDCSSYLQLLPWLLIPRKLSVLQSQLFV